MFDFLLRMRIRRRLILGFGFLLLLVLAIGIGVLIRIDQLNQRARATYEQPFALAGRTLHTEQTVEQLRRLTRDELVEGDATRRTAILSQMNQLDGDLRQQLQSLRDVAPDARRPDEIIAIATAWRTWRDETIR